MLLKQNGPGEGISKDISSNVIYLVATEYCVTDVRRLGDSDACLQFVSFQGQALTVNANISYYRS